MAETKKSQEDLKSNKANQSQIRFKKHQKFK
jgi:hypothetical protein